MAALFLLLPAAMLIFAYRAYMSERRRHGELEFLHEATGALSRSPQIVPELEVLLERTRDAFRVDFAELVLFSAEFGPSLRSTLGPGDRKQMLESLDEPVVNRLLEFAETQAGVIAARGASSRPTCASGGPTAACATACWWRSAARAAWWACWCWPSAWAWTAPSAPTSCGWSRPSRAT